VSSASRARARAKLSAEDLLIFLTIYFFVIQVIARARHAASRIISGHDDRLIVIVGPCSIHDVEQAKAYATLLKEATPKWDHLLIIMRSYFEKPRTNVGCESSSRS
jgi:phospho-2-dehydro-3-deoxyheptonate aldolase